MNLREMFSYDALTIFEKKQKNMEIRPTPAPMYLGLSNMHITEGSSAKLAVGNNIRSRIWGKAPQKYLTIIILSIFKALLFQKFQF